MLATLVALVAEVVRTAARSPYGMSVPLILKIWILPTILCKNPRIRPVGVEFHADKRTDGRTDRHEAVRTSCAKASEKEGVACCCIYVFRVPK
jgi:hypothetical protein